VDVGAKVRYADRSLTWADSNDFVRRSTSFGLKPRSVKRRWTSTLVIKLRRTLRARTSSSSRLYVSNVHPLYHYYTRPKDRCQMKGLAFGAKGGYPAASLVQTDSNSGVNRSMSVGFNPLSIKRRRTSTSLSEAMMIEIRRISSSENVVIFITLLYQ
jgi:hypothetical protein